MYCNYLSAYRKVESKLIVIFLLITIRPKCLLCKLITSQAFPYLVFMMKSINFQTQFFFQLSKN